jgi:AraC-like DNA-binding protein
MTRIAITDFDFETQPADTDALIEAWTPEIETLLLTHYQDNRLVSFIISAIKLGSRYKSLDALNIIKITQNSGYSRSTFFRLFETRTAFLLKGYQTVCQLSGQVYEKYLREQALSTDNFCTYTVDVFYGANCTIPHDVLQMLWQEHNLTHKEFHPHVAGLALVMRDYLAENPQTAHLQIEVDELSGVLNNLDLVILNARLEDDEQWGTPFFYKKLLKMLKGYLITCE